MTVCDVISITHSDKSTDNYHPTVQFPSALISNLFPAAAGSCFQLIKALIAYCSLLVQNKPADKHSYRLAGEHGTAFGSSTSESSMVVSIRLKPYQLCKYMSPCVVQMAWVGNIPWMPTSKCAFVRIFTMKKLRKVGGAGQKREENRK